MRIEEAIGKRIQRLREKKQITQAALGKMIQVSRAVVSKWECGISAPGAADLASIAAALETSCDYLICGISAKNRTISAEFGLTEKAIDSLEWFVESNQHGATEFFCDIVADWDCFSDLAACVERHMKKRKEELLLFTNADMTELTEDEKKERLKNMMTCHEEADYALLSAYEYSRRLVNQIIELRIKEGR